MGFLFYCVKTSPLADQPPGKGLQRVRVLIIFPSARNTHTIRESVSRAADRTDVFACWPRQMRRLARVAAVPRPTSTPTRSPGSSLRMKPTVRVAQIPRIPQRARTGGCIWLEKEVSGPIPYMLRPIKQIGEAFKRPANGPRGWTGIMLLLAIKSM